MSNSFNALIPAWLRTYQRRWLVGDLTAGAIVTVMLIPQSLGYAMLAGLPPQMGLYASIVPLFAYALFGSSMSLAVGPVAIISLMTASALQPLALAGSLEYIQMAMLLAMLSGLFLVAFGLLKLGALSHLLSHPVMSGFITGSALLIILGQLKPLLGLNYRADSAWPFLHQGTMGVGLVTLAFLLATRIYAKALLMFMGCSQFLANLMARLAPMLAVIVATALSAYFNWADTQNMSVVGAVPVGLPSLVVSFDWSKVLSLWLPALLIGLVGSVESISVARALSKLSKLSKRAKEKTVHNEPCPTANINPNKELLGLGAANIASSFFGGYPVTGGLARSVVNFDSGAQTPLAGVISALLMGLVLMGFTSYFYHLPHAVLAATIIVAVSGLVDFSLVKRAWRFDRSDAIAFMVTMLGVLIVGVELGIVAGVALSLAAMVYKTSRPHVAEVGRIHGSEHFRNINRHQVETLPSVIALRIDENLYFGNAVLIEELIDHLVKSRQSQTNTRIAHLVLVMSAVNRIDYTALEALESIHQSLSAQHIALHFAEVKGPVMDMLKTTPFFSGLERASRVYMSTHEAFMALEKIGPTQQK